MEISQGGDDSYQKKFALPVDSEHKSTEFRLFSVAAPHMRAFHLSWISFFACFVSTFAAPPLLPIIRDNLDLTATDIGNAGIAAVSGAVFARIAMGTACDLFGPRLASASLTLLTAPAVYCTSIANSPVSFLLVRFFTGFSLATFVSTQFWMSSMFSARVVGTANGVAGGWGNLGGGATQLIMPLVFDLIHHIGATKFTAWRIAFFIPALFQSLSAQFWAGKSFLQTWRRDAVGSYAKKFGMRGRLWTLWIVQTLGGVFCILLGKVGSLGVSIAVMIIFSVFVQAACGLTFGVVPFVSRRHHIWDDWWRWKRRRGSNSSNFLQRI
ncbi:UNVERIFIED_CONTAM: High affinity nitrate transporter 2.5 [Sesamum radiatum]|uniref:High affinity nitrate transporter 2.5 n=1 Tax=Sesamum radiatum TaxID=300843 RepID=A0AAW2JRW7_SESRA